MDFDGVSYLDVAGNYLRGDWHAAVNAYWSPLYSWLLVLPLSFLHSSLYWESTLVHLVDFAVLLASYAAFEFLLGELLRSRPVLRSEQEGTIGLSESAWRVLGLALFLFSSLSLANYNGSTPDLCVTVAVYAAAGLLLRIQSGLGGWATYLWLGTALGLGYLAKAAMFPLAFAFFGVALLAPPARARALHRLVVSVLIFALIAGPWVAVLSHSKGRLTFGDSGKLNYINDSGAASGIGFWASDPVPGIEFTHPLHRVGAHPVVFVFPGPVSGTYPPWFDPTYWLEGAQIKFNVHAQLRSLHRAYDAYWDILMEQGAFLLALLAFLFAQGAFRKNAARLARLWVLWLPGLAAMGMYSLLHVETRFIAAFVVLVWLGPFATLRFPEDMHSHRWVVAVVFALFLVTFIPIARNLVSDAHRVLRPPPDADWAAAQELHRLGVPPGGAIALIGMPKETFYFAHLARVRIVAALPPEGVGEYWSAPPDVQARVRSVFVGAGATAVVAPQVPPGDNPPGWFQIGPSSYWIVLLSNSVTTSSPAQPTGNSESTHE